MKKLLLIGAMVVVAVAGIMIFRNRLGMEMFSRSSQQSGSDVMIMNDSSDAVSIEYKEDGKDVAQVVQPGESVTGGKGYIRIFTAKKSGSYELTYEFPRPAGSTQQVTVSQIIGVVKNGKIANELYTKKGMIGDIEVEYEEVEDLASTY